MARSALGGISIVHRGDGPPGVWAPVAPGQTIYVGSMVSAARLDAGYSEGVNTQLEADGVADVTNLDTIYGICIGTNNYTPAYSSTYKTEYITAAAAAGPHTNTTDFRNAEGPWSKGDSGSRAFVKLDIVRPGDVLRAPLYNDAVGTAPSLLTTTVGDASGLSCTTNATDVAGVDALCTMYFRSGANAGVYRITDDTSTTALTWDVATPFDVAVGDTGVRVPVRPFGKSYVRFGTDDNYNGYINTAATPATNYTVINVLRLDLSEAAAEFCDFMFDSVMFNSVVRQNTT